MVLFPILLASNFAPFARTFAHSVVILRQAQDDKPQSTQSDRRERGALE